MLEIVLDGNEYGALTVSAGKDVYEVFVGGARLSRTATSLVFTGDSFSLEVPLDALPIQDDV